MTFTSAQFWTCNVCGTRGPEFEGTAEEVLPKEWWTGELRCPTERAAGGMFRAAVAICPDCANDTGLHLPGQN